MQPETTKGGPSPDGRSVPRGADPALRSDSVDAALAGFSIDTDRTSLTRSSTSSHEIASGIQSPFQHAKLLSAFTQTISAIEADISSAKSPNFIALLTSSSELRGALDAEIQTERQVERDLEALYSLVSYLEKTVLKPAEERYQSATGFLDGHSGLAEASWSLSALASFGLAAGLVLTYEHSILHAVSHFVHEILGYSPLSYVATAGIQGGVIVAQGVACFAGALVGPSLLGLIKTLGGRCIRSASMSRNSAFQSLALQAKDELGDYRLLTSRIAERMSELQPRLSALYARNDEVRKLVSATIDRLSNYPDALSVGDFSELHQRSSALGDAEKITMMRSLNLEKKLRELNHIDFRSPELVEAASENHHHSTRVFGLGRGLRLSVRSFVSLFHTAMTIGERSAIHAARKSRDTFENLPNNPVADILSGMGSGVSTTIEQALRAGTQPGKTTYSFLKGVLGLSKGVLVGGEKEGPRLETLLKVMFDLPELEKGNRIRFFSKLIPSLIRAATQKPIIMEQAEQVEELAGNVSPKGIETKLAERQGSYASSKKMAKNLFSLAYETSREALVRYGYVVPLKQIRASPIIRGIAPGASQWASKRLELHDGARHLLLQKKMEHELRALPNASTVAQLQDNELDLYVIEKYIEYSYRPATTITHKELTSLLHYWELRRKAAWHEAADSHEKHGEELEALHPQFWWIRKILHTKSNLFSSVTRGLLFGKDTNTDSQLSPEEVLTASFTSWSIPLEGLVKPSSPTILDATPNGMHVALVDERGSLRLLKAGEVRALFSKTANSPALQVLPHADHARITACEMILAMRLEPYQRRTLIETHYGLLLGELSDTQALERLVHAGIPSGQLSSTDSRGIFDQGLIGQAKSNEA